MVSLGRRWDGDTRGAGIGNSGWISDDVDQFRAALTEPEGIAESVSYLRQRVELDTVRYDVVTGMLPTDTSFQPNGHLIELRIGRPDVAALCAGRRVAPRGGM